MKIKPTKWYVISCTCISTCVYIDDVWFDREPQKAAQCYTEAKEGLETEAFLTQSLLQTDELNPRVLEVLYYLKVRALTALLYLSLLLHWCIWCYYCTSVFDVINAPSPLGFGRYMYQSLGLIPGPRSKQHCDILCVSVRRKLNHWFDFSYRSFDNLRSLTVRIQLSI